MTRKSRIQVLSSAGVNYSTFRFLMLHDKDGFPGQNWSGWFRRTLTDEGYRVMVPQLATKVPKHDAARLYPEGVPKACTGYEHQNLASWRATAEEAVGQWNRERTILVGHGYGALMALRLAQDAAQEQTRPYHAVYAVAPVGALLESSEEGRAGLTSFLAGFNPALVREGAKHITVMASTDDGVVPYAQSRQLAERVQADRLATFARSGHFDHQTSCYKLPGLLHYIDEMTGHVPVRPLPPRVTVESFRADCRPGS